MSRDLTFLLSQISELDKQLTTQAVKTIDRLLTMRNWLIGAYIVEYEQNGSDKAVYGAKLEQTLAEKLNRKGLSERNLKLFKQFYFAYPQIMQTVSAQFKLPQQTMQTVSAPLTNQENTSYVNDLLDHVSFSHFTELIKISDTQKRQFYEIQCMKSTWSVRELKRQINSLSFERTALAQNKEQVLDAIASHAEIQTPQSLIKTPFVFDFLDLPDSVLGSESDFENALVSDLKNFMLELGHGFCFEGQQKRIIIGGEYFFIDLVFYHRVLKCHVLIELKVDGFNHAHVGQLNTYLQYYKQNIQETTDNPPIGILLCTNKNDELVEYALGGMDENLFVSTYQTALPSREELKHFLKEEKRKIER